MKILFASSEYFPLIRTDDVADFAAGLANTIGQLSHDIRVIIPAYPEAVNAARPLKIVTTLEFSGCNETIRVLEGKIKNHTHPVYLIDAPSMFSRHGHPYLDAKGNKRPDNLMRFGLFSQAVAQIALNHAGLSWRPDVVHCNSWQTGLVPAMLAQDWNRPATVFSFHQVSNQGDETIERAMTLKIPSAIKESPNTRIHGAFSLLKAGITYSDAVVSSSDGFVQKFDQLPIDPEFKKSFGALGERFVGINTALDNDRWNPVNDEFIQQPFDTSTIDLKAGNKTALQQRFDLPETDEPMTITIFDSVTEYNDDSELIQSSLLDELLQNSGCQLIACCETVQPSRVLLDLMNKYPEQLAICTQPGESDLHYLIAGSDAAVFSNEKRGTRLLPEACLRYGTVPVLSNSMNNNAGLVDATSENLMQNRANAYLYHSTLLGEILPVMQRMTKYYQRKGPWWKKFAATGMQHKNPDQQTLIKSAHQYLECYQFAIDNPASNPDKK